MIKTFLISSVGKTCAFQIGFEKWIFQNWIENWLQIIGVFDLEKTKMFSTALVLVVMEKKNALSKLDLKNALQAFFKYD